jgi:hypothetical protein
MYIYIYMYYCSSDMYQSETEIEYSKDVK